MLFDYIKSREDLTARAADLFGRLASGEIKAHVGQRVALRDAADAHRDLEGRRTMAPRCCCPKPRVPYKLASMNAGQLRLG